MSLQAHARLDALRVEVELLAVDTAALCKPARDAIHSATSDLRAEFCSSIADLLVRVEAVEKAMAANGESEVGEGGQGMSPGRRGSRGAGLWKVVECSMHDQEMRLLEAVAQRGDAADGAVEKCDPQLPDGVHARAVPSGRWRINLQHRSCSSRAAFQCYVSSSYDSCIEGGVWQ